LPKPLGRDIRDLARSGFELNSEIDLRSTTPSARNYEIGTIAHMALPSEDLPGDGEIVHALEALLTAYDQLIVDEPDDPSPGPEEPEAVPYSVDDAVQDLCYGPR
jgi:hypothetical protein